MARSFDGSNDGLSLGSAPTTATTLTLCGWFWVNTGAASCALISLGVSGSAANRRDLVYNTTGTLFQARSINNASAVNQAQLSAVGFFDQWVFLAGVWNGVADRTLYRGTTTNNNTNSNSPNNPNMLRIGISPSTSLPLAGRAAECALWDVALGATELAMLARGMSPVALSRKPLGYWPLIGRTSPEIDLIGRNELTLVDAPAVIEHPRIYLPRSRSAMVRTAASAAPKRYLLVR